jgi:hypothetical protein
VVRSSAASDVYKRQLLDAVKQLHFSILQKKSQGFLVVNQFFL